MWTRESIEEFLNDRYDEMLAWEDETEREWTSEEDDELDILGEWYGCYTDYMEALYAIAEYYGLEIS